MAVDNAHWQSALPFGARSTQQHRCAHRHRRFLSPHHHYLYPPAPPSWNQMSPTLQSLMLSRPTRLQSSPLTLSCLLARFGLRRPSHRTYLSSSQRRRHRSPLSRVRQGRSRMTIPRLLLHPPMSPRRQHRLNHHCCPARESLPCCPDRRVWPRTHSAFRQMTPAGQHLRLFTRPAPIGDSMLAPDSKSNYVGDECWHTVEPGSADKR